MNVKRWTATAGAALVACAMGIPMGVPMAVPTAAPTAEAKAATKAAIKAATKAATKAAPDAARADGARVGSDLSAQARTPPQRRARTRIEVRPLRGPLRRDCVPVFEERWIPQWGGRVLYAGQDCHWTRAPL